MQVDFGGSDGGGDTLCVKLFLLRIELTRLPDAAPRVPSFGAAEMTVKRRMGAHENLDAFLTAQLAHMLLVKSFRIASSSGTCRLKKKKRWLAVNAE